MTDPISNAHRVIDYLAACVTAEQDARQQLVLGVQGVIVATSGAAPLGGGSVLLDDNSETQRWLSRQRSAGSSSLYAAWPLVQDFDTTGGRRGVVVAGLLRTEVAVQPDPELAGRQRVVPTSRAVELDEAGLRALGVPTDERLDLLDSFAAMLSGGTDDALSVAIAFAVGHGLMPPDLDPSELGPRIPGAGLSPSALVWVGDGGTSAFTRTLLADLAALRKSAPSDLEKGPFGALFGVSDQLAGVTLRPTPAVLATTLGQERAICQSSDSVLTVVTGPPGTGKSQVLANAVATAMARGETVLLASKNNHAIDVVHERVRSMSGDAVPIRAGKAALRAEAARAMNSALTAAQPDRSDASNARRKWQRVEESVQGPYRQAEERVQVLEAREVAVRRIDIARTALPPGTLTDPSTVEIDALAAAVGRARRHHDEWVATPGRWFWQRRRKRAAEATMDESLMTVATLIGAGASEAAQAALADGDPETLFDLAGKILAEVQAHEALAGLDTRLAVLPDPRTTDDAISASYLLRHAAASDLHGSLWVERLRDGAPGRPAARQYQAALAARAESGSSISPIRSQFPAALDVFPVWSVTSLVAGSWFPLDAGLFDLVVIDEASQSDLASALPLLFRAKRAMVVGDPGQLAHITNLSPVLDQRLADDAGLSEEDHGRFSYRDVSLYGLAASRISGDPVLLDRHFRSHPDVIGFSNEAFYGGRLRVETDPSQFLSGAGFVWRDTPGAHAPGPGGRSTENLPEAKAVVDVVAEVLAELEGSERTLGVVTPFSPQKRLLTDLIAARFGQLDIAVDTAHGFQGDERDVMILSLGIASDTPPGLVRFAGNPNLLNVALTRARARMIVVGDRRAALEAGGLLADLVAYSDRI